MERLRSYYAFLAAASACWGVATVISKQAIAEIPPVALLPIQLSVSTVALTLLMKFTGSRLSLGAESRRLGALGFLNPGLSYALGLAGLTQITASLSVVLWATEPLMILGLAGWLLHEWITRPMAIAMATATLGVLLVVWEAGGAGTLPGVALTLAGVAACAIYTVVVRKWLAVDSTLSVITVQQLCALLFSLALLGLAFLGGADINFAGWSSAAWTSAAISGLLYYAIAFWFYLTGLRQVPAAVAGLFLNLIPIFGVAAGFVLLGERLSSLQVLGALVIVGSVGAILWIHSRLTSELSSIIVDSR